MFRYFKYIVLSSLAFVIAGCGGSDIARTFFGEGGSSYGDSRARVANAWFSDDGSSNDLNLWVENSLVGIEVPGGGVTAYNVAPSGPKNLRIRLSIMAALGDMYSGSVNLTSGKSHTIVIHLAFPMMAAYALENDLTTPAPGNAKIRVTNTNTESVDFIFTGASNQTLRRVNYRAASGYIQVPAGTYRIQTLKAGTSQVMGDVSNVSLTAGKVYTYIAHRGRTGSIPTGIMVEESN